MTLTREQRAERAHNLLQDQLLQESFNVLKDTYTAALRGCNAKDDIGRFRYAVALDVIDGVTRHLTSVLNLGQLNPKAGQEFQTPNAIQKIARIF